MGPNPRVGGDFIEERGGVALVTVGAQVVGPQGVDRDEHDVGGAIGGGPAHKGRRPIGSLLRAGQEHQGEEPADTPIPSTQQECPPFLSR